MKPENPLLDFQVSASTIRFPRFRIMDAHEKSGIDGVWKNIKPIVLKI